MFETSHQKNFKKTTKPSTFTTTHHTCDCLFKQHYFGVEDSYSRIDYILLSPVMSKSWVPAETYIPTVPNWGIGSDHRPIMAAFNTDAN